MLDRKFFAVVSAATLIACSDHVDGALDDGALDDGPLDATTAASSVGNGGDPDAASPPALDAGTRPSNAIDPCRHNCFPEFGFCIDPPPPGSFDEKRAELLLRCEPMIAERPRDAWTTPDAGGLVVRGHVAEGRCRDGSRVLLTHHGLGGQRFYFDTAGTFTGAEYAVDGITAECGRWHYWPAPIVCPYSTITRVYCGNYQEGPF